MGRHTLCHLPPSHPPPFSLTSVVLGPPDALHELRALRIPPQKRLRRRHRRSNHRRITILSPSRLQHTLSTLSSPHPLTLTHTSPAARSSWFQNPHTLLLTPLVIAPLTRQDTAPAIVTLSRVTTCSVTFTTLYLCITAALSLRLPPFLPSILLLVAVCRGLGGGGRQTDDPLLVTPQQYPLLAPWRPAFSPSRNLQQCNSKRARSQGKRDRKAR